MTTHRIKAQSNFLYVVLRVFLLFHIDFLSRVLSSIKHQERSHCPALYGVKVKIPCFGDAEAPPQPERGDIEGKREADHAGMHTLSLYQSCHANILTAHFRGTALEAREFRGSAYGCRKDLSLSM